MQGKNGQTSPKVPGRRCQSPKAVRMCGVLCVCVCVPSSGGGGVSDSVVTWRWW